MGKTMERLIAALALGLGCLLSAGAYAAADATPKDEARWRTEDATPQARYQTMKKEAAAAYRENTKQCKTMSKSERAACMKDAKANYDRDLADAKKASSNR
jgi:hypothetical protein